MPHGLVDNANSYTNRPGSGTEAIDDGGPMFPLLIPAMGGGKYAPGASVRVWLAGQALHNPGIVGCDSGMDDAAERCLLYADAIIARAKRGRDK